MNLTRTLLSGLIAISASVASAVTFPITSHYQDLGISEDGSKGHPSDKVTRVGERATAHDTAAVFLFALPELQPGQSVVDAVFSVGLDRQRNNPSFNVDLYGLGYRSIAAVDVSEFYDGEFNADPNAVGLQDDFMTPLVAGGAIVTTSETGSAALVNYLNELYQAGAVAGDFVALRLNGDAINPGSYVCYEVAMSTYDQGDALRPTLFVTVPEPSTTAGLIGAAAFGLVIMRRRRFFRR